MEMPVESRRITRRVVVAYLAFAGLWILLSDRVLLWFVADPKILTELQTVKGFLFVASTGLLLWVLLTRWFGRYAKDITAHRVRAEAESRHRHLLFDGLPVGLALCRMDGTLVEANPAYAAMLGRTVDEVLGLTYWEITPKEYAELEAQQLELLRTTGRYGPYEKEYLHRDGGRVPVRLQGRVIELEGERYIWSSIEDISDRVRAQRRREHLDRVIAELTEAMSDGFAALDRDWRYTYVNRRGAALLGRAPEDLVGRNVWDEFPEGVGQPFHAAYERVMHARRPESIEAYFEPWDRWFENRIQPSADGIAIYFQDITARKLAEIALRESETRYRMTFEHAPVGIAHVSLDGRFLQVNPALCAFLGRDAGDLQARTFQAITHPEDVDADLAQVKALLAGETTGFSMEKRYLRPDGAAVWAQLTVVLLHDGDGRPLHFISIIADIHARKTAETALRASEERLREAQRIGRLGSWELDHASGGLTWSDEVYRIFEMPSGSPVTLERLLEAVHPADRPAVDRSFRDHLEGGAPYDLVHRLLLGDGRVRHVRERCITQRDIAGEPLLSIGTVQDVTESVEAERALSEANRQLQTLSRKVIEVQESERQRIAHDLHDEIGQALTAVKLTLQAVASRDAAGPDSALRSAIDVTDQALARARGLASELRPPELDDLGLVAAIRGHVTARVPPPIRTEFSADDLPALPGGAEIAMFRVAQEAVTNALRHAGARTLRVALRANGARACLEVADDGRGFDLARHEGGLGLIGMRERAIAVGGVLAVESSPGRGTRVELCVPRAGVEGAQ